MSATGEQTRMSPVNYQCRPWMQKPIEVDVLTLIQSSRQLGPSRSAEFHFPILCTVSSLIETRNPPKHRPIMKHKPLGHHFSLNDVELNHYRQPAEVTRTACGGLRIGQLHFAEKLLCWTALNTDIVNYNYYVSYVG